MRMRADWARRVGLFVMAAVLLCSLSARVYAQASWSGAVSTFWSDPLNWNPNAVPVAGESIIIQDSTTNSTLDVDTSVTVGTIQFGTVGARNSNFTMQTGVNAMTVTGGLTATGNLDALRLSLIGDYNLPVDQTWTVGGQIGAVNADRGVFIRGANSSDIGTIQLDGTLTKTGSGQLVIGATTVDGPGDIVVNQGAFKLNAGFSSLLTVGGTGKIIVNDGASLFVSKNSGTMSVTRAIELNGASTLAAGGGGDGSANTIDSAIAWNGSHSLTMINNNPTSFAGPWTGSGTIRRNGGQTITLSGASDAFAGRLIIQGGITRLAGSLGGTVEVTGGEVAVDSSQSGALLVNGGTVTLADAALSLGGLAGTGGTLVASGANTALTLNQAADSAFSGGISVAAGAGLSLVKEGTGNLLLTGGIAPATRVAVNAGGLGVFGSVATYTQTGGALWLGLGSGPAAADNQTLITAGDAAFGPGSTITLRSLTGTLGSGTYRLVTAGNQLIGADGVTIGFESPTRSVATPLVDAAAKSLDVVVTANAADLVWAGTNPVWDVAGAASFTNTGTGQPDQFFSLDNVRFDDTAGGADPTMAGTVIPGSVVFDNTTRDYLLGGTGSLAGATGIVKRGTGSLTLATANGYSGGTTLTAGRLVLASDAAVGTGSVTISGGTLTADSGDQRAIAGGLVLAGDATFGEAATPGSLSFAGGGSVTGDRTITTIADVTIAGIVAGEGFGLTKAGAGSLVFGANNTYTGATAVTAGTLGLGTGGTAGSVAGGISVADGATVRWLRGDQSIDVTNVITGAGTLAFRGMGVTSQSSYVIGGDNSSFTGSVVVETGARVRVNAASDIAAAPVRVESGGGVFLETGGTYPNDFTISGNGWRETAGEVGAIRLQSDADVGGDITLVGDARIAVSGSTGIISGNIGELGGARSLELRNFSGTGSLTLSGATVLSGGLSITPASGNTTTVNLASTGSLTIGGAGIRIGNTAAAGTTTQTLNVAGTVTNTGPLLVGRPGTLNLNSGATWTQSDGFTIAAQGGYTARMAVNTGASFTYSGSSPVLLNGANANSGQALLTINGGTLITSAGFVQTTTPTTGFGRVTLSGGGTIGLTAAVPQLTTSVEFVLGTGGGTIDTNGYDAGIAASITGAGGLTKAGVGTLALEGFNTFEGPVAVTGGTLALGLSSPLAPTVGLNLAGGTITQAGGLYWYPGQTMQLGGAGQTGGGAVAGSLILGGGTIGFDVASTTDYDTLTIPSGGSLDLQAATFAFTPLTGTLASGTYDLIRYGGSSFTGSVAGITATGIATSDSRQTIGFADSGSAVQLVVSGGAANLTWTGAVDGTWNSGATGTANWTTSQPVADPTRFYQGDSVAFTGQGAGTITVAAPTTVGQLDVSGSSDYTLAGPGTVAAAIVTKSGLGRLTLDTPLTASVSLTVAGGSLLAAGVEMLGASPLILDGGRVEIAGFGGTLATPLSTGVAGGTLAFPGTGLSVDAPTGGALGGLLTVDVADPLGTVRSAGSFTGAGGLAKTGGGSLAVSGASSFDGGVAVTAGTLQALSNGALGSSVGGTTVASGATLSLAGDMAANSLNLGNEAITIAGAGSGGAGAIVHDGPNEQQNAVRFVTLAADSTIGGVSRWDIRGTSATAGRLDLAGHTLTKTGTNTVYVVDGELTAGNVLVTGGTFGFTRASTAGTGQITVESGADLSLSFGAPVAGAVEVPILMNGGRLTSVSGTNAAASDIRLAAATEFSVTGTTLTLSGDIVEQGGSFGVLKTGGGTLTLSGTNNLTGPTTINGGILQVNSDTAVGTGPITIANTGLANTTHSLRLSNVTLTNDVESSYMYSADYTGVIAAIGGGLSTLAGDVTIRPVVGTGSRGGHLASIGAGSVLRLTGELNAGDGLGQITQRDGVVEYGGGASSAYRLQITNTARLVADNGIGVGVNIQLAPSQVAVLDLNGFDQQLEGITRSTYSGTVTNGGATPSVLTIANTANYDFSGVIQDGTGGVSFVKSGPGTFTLSGGNTFTGPATISEGTLALTAAGALAGAGQVAVGTGATLDVAGLASGYAVPAGQSIGGLGTVVGSIGIGVDATLSPGASPGTLTVSQDVVLGSGGNYNWQIASAAGGGYDLLSATGAIQITATAADPFKINLWTLSGVNPDVSGPMIGFDPSTTTSWTLATAAGGITGFAADAFTVNTAATNGTGGFANPFGGGTFAVAQAGNDLQVVYTPGSAPTDIVIDVPSGSQTQAQAGYATIASATSVRKVGGGTVIFDAANAYTGPTTIAAGTLQVANADALGSTSVTVDTGATLAVASGTTMKAPTVIVDGGTLSAAALTVNASTGIASLAINAGTLAGSTALAITGGGQMALVQDARVSVSVGSLAIAETSGGGRLDLGAGQVSIAAGGISAADLRADIIAGRNGGGWNGTTGIISSTAASSGGTRAVGYVVAGDGSARVSFAASGDVDLNGQVNVFDLVSINSSGKYGTGQSAVWNQGDFNYDGVTNVFDLVGINTAAVYGQGNYLPASPSVAGLGSVAAVPEPRPGLMLAAAALSGWIAARSRRGRSG